MRTANKDHTWLTWLRQAAAEWNVGESVVRSAPAASALEAVGLLARAAVGSSAALIRFLGSSAVRIDDERLDVVLCRERKTTSEIEAIATERAGRVVGRIGPQERLHLLIAASSVRGPKPRDLEGVDVVDPDAAVDELVGAERHVEIRLTWVDEVLAAA